MNKLRTFNYLTVSLALFAMFFGAGNIIFPLALGQIALDKTPWGLSGLLLTAVVMPFMGILAMFRCQGQINLFFNILGKIPGLIIALLIISLLGPLGAVPRCIALAHSTLLLSFPNISLILFSASACLLIFLFAYRENRLLKLLGYFLSPLKISLLILIIIKGFTEAPEAMLISKNQSETSYFLYGLTQGYNTMDLLAAFFFAPIIISSLSGSEKNSRFMLITCTIGAILLATVYIGFCYLAYLYSHELNGIPSDQLLGVIALKILGPYAGLIVSLTVTFACLTTAIALIAAFTNFLHKEILKKSDRIPILFISLVTTFGITTLQFQGIARFLNPVLEICYPGLILLTFYNLFRPITSYSDTNIPFLDKEKSKTVIV
jgi:LIVCS family branched-chain amino acid:cation transporter